MNEQPQPYQQLELLYREEKQILELIQKAEHNYAPDEELFDLKQGLGNIRERINKLEEENPSGDTETW